MQTLLSISVYFIWLAWISMRLGRKLWHNYGTGQISWAMAGLLLGAGVATVSIAAYLAYGTFAAEIAQLGWQDEKLSIHPTHCTLEIPFFITIPILICLTALLYLFAIGPAGTCGVALAYALREFIFPKRLKLLGCGRHSFHRWSEREAPLERYTISLFLFGGWWLCVVTGFFAYSFTH